MGAAARVYLSLGADIKAEVTGLNLFWVCWGDRPSLLTCFCCVNKLTHSLAPSPNRCGCGGWFYKRTCSQPTAPIRQQGRSSMHTNTTSKKFLLWAGALRRIPKLNSKNDHNFFANGMLSIRKMPFASVSMPRSSSATQYITMHVLYVKGGDWKVLRWRKEFVAFEFLSSRSTRLAV